MKYKRPSISVFTSSARRRPSNTSQSGESSRGSGAHTKLMKPAKTKRRGTTAAQPPEPLKAAVPSSLSSQLPNKRRSPSAAWRNAYSMCGRRSLIPAHYHVSCAPSFRSSDAVRARRSVHSRRTRRAHRPRCQRGLHRARHRPSLRHSGAALVRARASRSTRMRKGETRRCAWCSRR